VDQDYPLDLTVPLLYICQLGHASVANGDVATSVPSASVEISKSEKA
jgi:hypothetical protein